METHPDISFVNNNYSVLSIAYKGKCILVLRGSVACEFNNTVDALMYVNTVIPGIPHVLADFSSRPHNIMYRDGK